MPVNNIDHTAENVRGHEIDHQHVARHGHNEPDLPGSRLPNQSSLETKMSNNLGSSAIVEGGRSGSFPQLGGPSRSGRQDNFLHIPQEGGAARRPPETTVWDWDTPLESVGESSSYYYEPQGELLQEPQRRPGPEEFSIPQVITGVHGSDWPVHIPSDSFAVPKRPQGVPPSIAGNKRKLTSDRETPGINRHSDPKRPTREGMAGSGDDTASSSDARRPSYNTRSLSGTGGSDNQPQDSARPEGGGDRTLENPTIPMVLPPRKVFPIQIGDKLFRLSGASISSDAPSYFSQFFEEQLRQKEGADSVRTLYIDRDPATFEDIALHLQGYHILPRDGPHFVKLFADAQFYSLPRLTAQLFSSTIYIRIGDEEFQIPRDLFSNPGDSPNYFSLGFAIFFTTPTEVFPGLSQRTLLRPPSILPPSIPNRSAKTFADLLHVLKGYPLEVRSEEHRAELLRDARYFHLKGLEQRLIPHSISFNLARKRNEIVLRLEDIRQSGISFVADGANQQPAGDTSPESSVASSPPGGPGWIYYQRPYVDSEAYSLIIEITGTESTFLSLAPGSGSSPARVGRAMFHKQSLSRITSLFSVIANKMNLPITQPLGLMMMERGAGVASLPVSPGNTGVSEERVKVRLGPDADVTVDGRQWNAGGEDEDDDEDDESEMDIDPSESSRKKRKRNDGSDEGEDWVLKKAQWRLRVQPISGGAQGRQSGMEVILGAVKIEAYSSEKARNGARKFLV